MDPGTVESITVHGSGVVLAVPDVMRVEVGVQARDVHPDAALAAANRAMAAVVQDLLGAGVDPADVRTTRLDLRTDYDRQGRAVAGYVATQGLAVVLRDLGVAGARLSAALGAAGDAARLDGLQLDVADDRELAAQAREAAVADARQRAETYAGAAGRSLGRVLRITEVSPDGPVPVRARVMAAEAGPVPVQPGSQEVRARVAVEWALV